MSSTMNTKDRTEQLPLQPYCKPHSHNLHSPTSRGVFKKGKLAWLEQGLKHRTMLYLETKSINHSQRHIVLTKMSSKLIQWVHLYLKFTQHHSLWQPSRSRLLTWTVLCEGYLGWEREKRRVLDPCTKSDFWVWHEWGCHALREVCFPSQPGSFDSPTTTSLCTAQGGQRGTLIWEHRILSHTARCRYSISFGAGGERKFTQCSALASDYNPSINFLQLSGKSIEGCTAFGQCQKWEMGSGRGCGMMGAAGRDLEMLIQVVGHGKGKGVSYLCLPVSWECRMREMGSAWWVLCVLSPQWRV